MKNLYKSIFFVLSVALVVFGAMFPTLFKKDFDEYEVSKNVINSQYSIQINVVSSKNYNINDATVTFQKVFKNDQFIKIINTQEITKSKDGNNYVHSFVLDLTKDEYFSYSNISSVVLKTDAGVITAAEKGSTNNSWITPVMIVVIVFGSGLVVAAIMSFVYPHLKQKEVGNIKNKVRTSNLDIDINNLTDDEIIDKYDEYLDKQEGEQQDEDIEEVDVEDAEELEEDENFDEEDEFSNESEEDEFEEDEEDEDFFSEDEEIDEEDEEDEDFFSKDEEDEVEDEEDFFSEDEEIDEESEEEDFFNDNEEDNEDEE